MIPMVNCCEYLLISRSYGKVFAGKLSKTGETVAVKVVIVGSTHDSAVFVISAWNHGYLMSGRRRR